jgi:hypothetical protein
MKSSEKESLLRVAFPSNATAQLTPTDSATSNATPSQHHPLKPASLLNLARNKLRNNHATSSQKTAQLEPSKQEVEVAHENGAIDEAQDVRQQRALELLQSNPALKYAVLVDDATTDPVLVTVGIRGLAVFNLEIPHAHYDGLALLQILEEHSLQETTGGNTQASTEGKECGTELPERKKTA